MAITHGMNPEEVQKLGDDLQNFAQNIAAMIKQIESKISHTTWVGPDAHAFKDQWWPGHRASLQRIQTDLHGFGQSAKNNASEQKDISRVK